MRIILGDSKIKLRELEANSVDSVVTDPPYGLSFMGKKWDYDVPSVELWREVLRVLKPGGHLLSFSGSRTYHRMVVNIEDAGFEIRDQIMWVYGSGFPKSHNIGKAVDKLQGNKRETIGKRISAFGDSEESETGDGRNLWKKPDTKEVILDKGISDLEGWGTALKPAHEPIVMARKPLSEKTIVQNVLKYGTGGINIDGCRVQMTEEDKSKSKNNWKPNNGHDSSNTLFKTGIKSLNTEQQPQGRFPANFIHDGSDEVVELFPNSKSTGGSGVKSMGALGDSKYGKYNKQLGANAGGLGDSGSASRFFYCAKASKKDRDEGLNEFEEKSATRRDDEQPYGMNTNKFRHDGSVRKETQPRKNNHPTVKPTALMKYLVRMVTPPKGIVLDPFMGSGSTGKACKLLDFDFIGIEMDEEYIEIAKARIENAGKNEEIEVSLEQKKKIHKFFTFE